MKLFIQKVIAFIVGLSVLLGLIICLPSYYMLTRDFQRGYYYSNLLYVSNSKHYDLVFLGSSHAKVFETCGSWELTENILKKETINLSDAGGGLINQQFYLKYLYSLSNKVETIFYFIDPFMLVSDSFDNVSYLNKEPFKIDFFLMGMKSEVKKKILINYVKSKISLPNNWLVLFMCKYKNQQVEKIDSNNMGERMTYLNNTKGINKNIFSKQKQTLNKTIEIILENDSKLIFIIPPTLFKKMLGYEELLELLEEIREEKGINYYDYHSSMKDLEFFYDYDHLNEKGIEFFTEKYLAKVLEEN